LEPPRSKTEYDRLRGILENVYAQVVTEFYSVTEDSSQSHASRRAYRGLQPSGHIEVRTFELLKMRLRAVKKYNNAVAWTHVVSLLREFTCWTQQRGASQKIWKHLVREEMDLQFSEFWKRVACSNDKIERPDGLVELEKLEKWIEAALILIRKNNAITRAKMKKGQDEDRQSAFMNKNTVKFFRYFRDQGGAPIGLSPTTLQMEDVNLDLQNVDKLSWSPDGKRISGRASSAQLQSSGSPQDNLFVKNQKVISMSAGVISWNPEMEPAREFAARHGADTIRACIEGMAKVPTNVQELKVAGGTIL